jgi:hypothetical protein
MPLPPIKPGGWDPEDIFTSDEANAFQDGLLGISADLETAEAAIVAAQADADNAQAVNALQASQLGLHEDWILRPDAYIDFVEDWFGAIHNSGGSRIDAQLPWRCGGTSGSVAVNARAGNSRHPGLLEVALPGNGVSDQDFHFELIGATAGMFLFSQIEQFICAVKIADHASNVTSRIRIGFAQDNSVYGGGTDALSLHHVKNAGASKWWLWRKRAGVEQQYDLGNQTVGEYAQVRFLKPQGTSNLEVYFGSPGTTPIVTLTSGQLPTGLCTFGAYIGTGSSDANVFTPSIDLMAVRFGFGGNRVGV